MSVLEICQKAAKVVGVNPPTTLVGSSNVMAQKLLEHLCQSAKDRRRDKPWPQLIRTGIITLTAGDANPTMPGDIMGYVHNTFWDISGGRPIEGPLNPSQWANVQWGIVNLGPFRKFRIAGRIATKRFELNPVPASGDTGEQIGFLYTSKNWLLPELWTASTTYAAGSYVSNATGLIYKTTLGGTSGSTIPVHTSGTASDTGVQWTYYDGVYEEPMKDTDISLFDDELMEMDLVWRFRKGTGMDYTEHKADADRLWSAYFVQSNGAPTLRMCGVSDNSLLMGERNIPDTGYGL
jgi:hypothetical protein